MAFFLSSCQVKTVYERPPVEKPVPDLYQMAELDFKEGRFEDAFNKYRLYLEKSPAGEKSRTALYRMARIRLDNHQNEEALSLLERIVSEYPDHPETPIIRHDIADLYYVLGDYQKSRDVSLEWLKKYPSHPLKAQVLFILGNSYKSLGNRVEAFRWWLNTATALSAGYNLPESRADLDDLIIDLINQSEADELMEMAEYGAGSLYIPPIYQRMASLYFDQGRLEEARKFAMLLVRSSRDPFLISWGREFIDRISKRKEEEVEVRKGAIGCLLPLSGPFGLYGEELLNGIQLGMGLFNQSAGDQGLELIIRDTRGSVEDTIAGIDDLVLKEKVMAIVGPLASGPATAAVKRAQELGVPIITFTQKDGIAKEGDMVFRNFLTPAKEINTILDKSMDEMGMRRFGIFYPDNPYGRFFMNLFWDKVEEKDGTITAVESYKVGETDFAVGIKKMVGLYYPRPDSIRQMLEEMENPAPDEAVADDPEREEEAGDGTGQEKDDEPPPIVDFDAVFVPDNYQQVALIAPQFPFYNVFNVPFLGTSLWLSKDLLETTGDYLQGAIFPAGFYPDKDSETVRAFVEAYRANFQSDPGVLAANGYDTIGLIKEIMGMERVKTRRDFREELAQDAFNGVTGKISFDPQGEVEKEPVLLTVYGKSLHLLKQP